MTTLTAYIGRDNADQLRLLKQGIVIPDNTVVKVELSFGDWCIETGVDSNIRLITSSTVVEMELGLTAGLVEGRYVGKLTVYDAVSVNGIAWSDLDIVIKPWQVC